MNSELNGQWLECNGIPCFCPDNSPTDFDLELEQTEKPNTNPQSKSQTEIDYDEF